MPIDHPAERGDEGRGLFERAAESASNLTSSPAFFTFCAALVLAWAAAYAVGLGTEIRTFLGDLLAAVTLALVALIKNAERRAEAAMQYKLDAIAQALLEMSRGADEGAADDLERAIGRHEEV